MATDVNGGGYAAGDIDAWFRTHASAEQIELRMRTVRELADQYTRRADLLGALLAERMAQVEAGTWPPAKLRDRSKRGNDGNG